LRGVGLVLLAACTAGAADKPCVSGPAEGKRPGPYSFVLCTGNQRGKSHCYICETADRPAVIVFARSLREPPAKLVQGLDRALVEHKKAELRAWVTFLHDDQSTFDPEVVGWAKKHAIRGVPLGVFEDQDGPPSYKLARDADVTVLLFVKQKVVVNAAFRAGELSEPKIKSVLASGPKITAAKK